MAGETFEPYETEAFRHAAEIFMRHGIRFLIACAHCQDAGRSPLMEININDEGKLKAKCECRELTFKERRGKKRRV